MLYVSEIFRSFQGEGVRTGLVTVFVRLAGCNLDCIWCDTRYARNREGAEEMGPESVLDEVEKLGSQNVCITGGEPMIQEEILDLIGILDRKGYRVDLETNGSVNLREVIDRYPKVFISMDVKNPSSGEEKSLDPENLDLLRSSDQVKFIVKDGRDLNFTLKFLKKKRPLSNVIITPCDNKGGEEIAGILDVELFKFQNSGDRDLKRTANRSRLMIQTHKIIWGDKRGV